MTDERVIPDTEEQRQATNGSRPAPAHHFDEPDPVQRPARLALYLGAVLVAVGTFALYKGYDGAAHTAIQVAQTPFIISGGLFGAALMVIGTVIIALHVLLRVQADFRREIAATRRSMEEVADSIARATALGGSRKTSTNGTVMVGRGSSSFHKADCRLVAGGTNVRPIPREDADRNGLTPCRICKP